MIPYKDVGNVDIALDPAEQYFKGDFQEAYIEVSDRLLLTCAQLNPSKELLKHFLVLIEALKIAQELKPEQL